MSSVNADNVGWFRELDTHAPCEKHPGALALILSDGGDAQGGCFNCIVEALPIELGRVYFTEGEVQVMWP